MAVLTGDLNPTLTLRGTELEINDRSNSNILQFTGDMNGEKQNNMPYIKNTVFFACCILQLLSLCWWRKAISTWDSLLL
jgi:hypothetical protein